MANMLAHGIGTGCSNGITTGAKIRFAYNEKIVACHKWNNIKNGDRLNISFQRYVNGAWKEEVKHNHLCNNGDGWYWHNSYIINYPAGDWKALFGHNERFVYVKPFVINPKPEPVVEPEIPEVKPEYPKRITRGEYSFEADNLEQETQMRDFLGIEPKGMTLDEYLSDLDKAGLDNWENYWKKVWGDFGRIDMLTFTSNKAEEYRAKLIVPIPEEPTWWDKLMEIARIVIPVKYGVAFKEADKLWSELTGVKFSEYRFKETGLSAVAFFTPLDELNKLFFGRNLSGEPEEFRPGEDTFNLIVDSLFFIPLTKIPIIGAKLFAKTGSKGILEVAGRAGLKGATPAQIEAIMKSGKLKLVRIKDPLTGEVSTEMMPTGYQYIMAAVREAPKVWAELMPKLSKDTKNVLIRSMSRLADPTAFNLAKKSLTEAAEKEGLTAFQKVIAIIPGKTTATKGLFAMGSLIGLASTYIGTGIFLAHTGREAIKEGITFAGLWNAIQDDNWEMARDMLPSVRWAIDGYIKAMSLAQTIPIIGEIYSDSIKAVNLEYDAWERLITEHFEKIEEEALLPPELPPEEKWEKIRQEQELWAEEQLKKKEEYYANLFAEMEKQKAQDVLEQAEYWENILAEREKARESERITDEEYWGKLEENRRTAEEEKRISEEEYWERLYEEERLREEEKRAADEQYWAEIYTQQETRKAETGKVSTTWSPTPYVRESYSAPIYPTLKKAEYGLLPSAPYEPIEYEKPAVPVRRELLVNIETTSLMPFEGRIYSIAMQDLSRPELAPMVLTSNNEIEVIDQFLNLFEQGDYEKIVGYNVSFDYRFIWTKMMQHRIQSSKFYYVDLVDVMQIMKQVKEEFVFGFNKPGKLEEWGKMILGKGKLSSQKTMLKRYISGDFDFLEAFQLRQLELTKGLYDLSRFAQSASVETSIPAIPEESSNPIQDNTTHYGTNLPEKKCFNCFQANPGTAKECSVCGKAF